MIVQPDSPYKREPEHCGEMLGIPDEVERSEGWAKVRMPIRPRHLQKAGVVQGGIIVTLADYAFYRAVATVVPKERLGATVELKMNFIAPAREGELIAESRIVHKGNRLLVADMTITNSDGMLIAKGLGTYTLFDNR